MATNTNKYHEETIKPYTDSKLYQISNLHLAKDGPNSAKQQSITVP